MTSREDENEQGYDRDRFIGEVKKDFICCICKDVLKDPRLCQEKEHAFCRACILRNLENANNCGCPICRDPLTPENLKRPSRFFMNSLSELELSCDYNVRGCPENVQLGNLNDHLRQCGFAPVTCQRCEIQINRRDKKNHDRSACQIEPAKCRDCSVIKASLDGMGQELYQIKANEIETRELINSAKNELHYYVQFTNTKLDALINNLDDTTTKLDATSTKLDATNTTLSSMASHVTGIRERQDETNQKVNEIQMIKENLEEIKQTQAVMKQQYGNISEMLTQLLQETNVDNKGAQALDLAVPVHSLINQDIIIIGGSCSLKNCDVLDSAEKFSVVEGKSSPLPPMNQRRTASALCTYNNDVIVAGGYDGKADTDTIEILTMKQFPLAWTLVDGKMPVNLSDHAAVLYQDNIIIIGGFDRSKMQRSNAIFEVRLVPFYTSKLLVRMPEPVRFHSAEVVNGNIFILGGTTTGSPKDATDRIVLYDAITNKFKPRPSLPRPIFGMSTVTWGHMIIVVGGVDKTGYALNEVFMYNTETGQSEKLPSMIYKRYGCSAVIMNDVIVVMGGWNEEQGCLNSVETFTIGSARWKKLPEMMEKRHFATAVVRPVV